MITIYRVISRADNCPCGPGRGGYLHERQDDAESYRVRLVGLTGEAVDAYEIEVVTLDTLPARRIKVTGSEIGYQFARESMGERSFVRTVTNVCRRDGQYHGETEVLGRKIKVASDHIWFIWRYAGDVE